MATSKTGGTGEKAAAKPAKAAGAAKGGGAAKKSGATAKKVGGTGAARKSAAGAAGGAGSAGKTPETAGTGGGAANVQPKGRAPAKRGGASGGGGDRRQVYRDFCESRLGGWSHDEWEGLLGDLQQRGHDVSDREAVGMELERERLSMVLEKVPGVSSQKAKSLVSRFGRLWDLRQASPDEIAEAGKVPRPLAERIAEAIR